jgi:hypothetical protein
VAKASSEEWSRTLIYAHGVRNVGFGAILIALATLYHSEPSPVAAQAIKRCLGIALLLGSVIPIGDAVITARHMAAEHVPQSGRDLARKASTAHALRSLVWIGAGTLCIRF